MAPQPAFTPPGAAPVQNTLLLFIPLFFLPPILPNTHILSDQHLSHVPLSAARGGVAPRHDLPPPAGGGGFEGGGKGGGKGKGKNKKNKNEVPPISTALAQFGNVIQPKVCQMDLRRS